MCNTKVKTLISPIINDYYIFRLAAIMGFEGYFHVSKGDLYTTGLKYNHTTSYKQKAEYYKRFVERALLDSGLTPIKSDIMGFGDGPLIRVHFRSYLDMRRLPK